MSAGPSNPLTIPTTNTSEMMPFLGLKHALAKFKGEHSEIGRFLDQYGKLCQLYNVTSDKEKCENITQYCSQSIHEVIEAL